MLNLKKTCGLVLGVVLAVPAHAGLISGGTLLNQQGADQLESWLGVADLDFTNVWSGGTGATAASWHAAVDGIGPSFSMYEVSYNNATYVIGGYSTVDWSGAGYAYDSSAFIFNLTDGVQQLLNPNFGYAQYSVFRHPSYFATYGGGHDIFGGSSTLNNTPGDDGYVYRGFSYGEYLGGNIVNYSSSTLPLHVSRLETYTFAAPSQTSVPEPGTLGLLGLGLAGVGFARRRSKR